MIPNFYLGIRCWGSPQEITKLRYFSELRFKIASTEASRTKIFTLKTVSVEQVGYIHHHFFQNMVTIWKKWVLIRSLGGSSEFFSNNNSSEKKKSCGLMRMKYHVIYTSIIIEKNSSFQCWYHLICSFFSRFEKSEEIGKRVKVEENTSSMENDL